MHTSEANIKRVKRIKCLGNFNIKNVTKNEKVKQFLRLRTRIPQFFSTAIKLKFNGEVQFINKNMSAEFQLIIFKSSLAHQMTI